MLSKRYRLINNVTGWIVFIVALITYWLTLEPTASYWDCGEFIIQADKLEVGHPPGNPIFMLTARFFANFAPDAQHVSVMVNAMSGLLSALTILLLFWTITHLVRRLVVKDGREEPSLQQYIAIIGSGVVGALAYCWSDTFWFSAVEGEVYAFSSFCTALVFWLILKWEDYADEPHSDRYLILIAYIIGISVAVHLLNLLCIPAIVLVFAYRKWSDMNLTKSLIALAVSFAIIVLVLYGLVPGFIKVAQQMELLFVNGLGMAFNSGAIAYAVVMSLLFVWALYELYRQRNATMIRVSFLLAICASGMLFLGDSLWIGILLLAALAVWLFFFCRRGLPVRVLSIIMWSTAVIFVGYSSYALILIRSNADTPMNQNAPDNVFDLAAYLNREQYGENPLIYGETLYSSPQKITRGSRLDTLTVTEDGYPITLSTPNYPDQVVEAGRPLWVKGVKGATPKSEYKLLNESDISNNNKLAGRGGDYYVKRDYKPEVKMNPELNMLFPRLYSRQHAALYGEWVTLDTVPGQLVGVSAIDGNTGEEVPELDINAPEPEYNETTGAIYWPQKQVYKPTFGQNLSYFFNYQLNHMYLRYFMWNFAGRQNDVLNQHGELDAGNWVSGIPMIDNPRLSDQSLLPDDLGKDNPGHNVYYMLPLILGIVGLLWQSFAGKRGIEQFWVVFFLFFMTGIAIVIYLNQTPNQPRERDYAFAGSFYAYAIWIGMGVAGLWRILLAAGRLRYNKRRAESGERRAERKGSAAESGERRAERPASVAEKETVKTVRASDFEEPIQLPSLTDEPRSLRRISVYCAAVAALSGLVVPLQMVSQTWDDHDRSGRYAARDFAINYLESLEPDAILFCNGDNDTFPLWYAQEVEGVRPDVRIVNLSYLNSDWYANQHRIQAYEAAPLHFTAKPSDYAYGLNDVTIINPTQTGPADLLTSLKAIYSGTSNHPTLGYRQLPSGIVTIPVDKEAVVKRGLVAPTDTANIVNEIAIDLGSCDAYRRKGYLSLGEILMLDIIATNAAEGWPRPIYWASTVGDEYNLGLDPYLRSVGMNHQLVPTIQSAKAPRTDRGVNVVTKKYRWGGADTRGRVPYFDETARRMLYTTRSSVLDLGSQLVYEGDLLKEKGDAKGAAAKYREAINVTRLALTKLPARTAPYEISLGLTAGQVLCEAGKSLGDKKAQAEGRDILLKLLKREAQYLRYVASLQSQGFLAPSLTYETKAMPYQYWRIAELYLENGGTMAEVEKIVKPTGFTTELLRRNYEQLSAGSAGTGALADEAGASPDEILADIDYVAGVVNDLATLSPADYAAASDESRLYDSLMWYVLEIYRSEGGTEDKLNALDSYVKLDKERSKRIYEEFIKKHPEYAGQQ